MPALIGQHCTTYFDAGHITLVGWQCIVQATRSDEATPTIHDHIAPPNNRNVSECARCRMLRL